MELPHSDQELLRRYLGGDRGAFDGLYHRYAPRVHATAYRLTGHWEDAEDTLQEVFIALARQAGRIRHGQALSTWIYRATINKATDHLRRRRAMVSLDADDPQTTRIIAMESLRLAADREAHSERERLLREIEALVPRLPERQAAVFVLRGFQGLTHAEIATVLDCSEVASRSSYSLACGRLREWLASAAEPGDLDRLLEGDAP